MKVTDIKVNSIDSNEAYQEHKAWKSYLCMACSRNVYASTRDFPESLRRHTGSQQHVDRIIHGSSLIPYFSMDSFRILGHGTSCVNDTALKSGAELCCFLLACSAILSIGLQAQKERRTNDPAKALNNVSTVLNNAFVADWAPEQDQTATHEGT